MLLSSKIEIEGQTADLVGEVTHHGALFGRNWYGETIESILYYTQRPLCNDQIPDTPDYIKENGYFLMVDRGECSFVEKVRNAQRDGAAAVFIADDRCLCSADGLCESDVDQDCERVEPVMDDDGSGSDIKIPSVLLLKSDADRLRRAIVSGNVIKTKLSFPIPKAINGRTEYMLFTTPDDQVSHQFLDSFLEAALDFGTKAVFEPRMLLTDGAQKGCRQYDESHEPCKGYCTNYGRYCLWPSVYDQERYEDKGTKGLIENIRRTCIWNIYGKVDGVGKEWWAYVQLWTLKCSFSQYSTSCAESVYATAGVDKEEVDICMENSGSFREDVLNTLMEASLSDTAKYQVKFAPTLVVNGAVVGGALTFGNAMKAICSTFEDFERPQICAKWDICSDVCNEDETCILWGESQECSEYMAPYLSNEGKEFDDDYLTFEIEDGSDIIGNEENEFDDEVSKYMAPYLGNEGKGFDDEVDDWMATEPPREKDLIIDDWMATEPPRMKDQTDLDYASPMVHNKDVITPPVVSGPQRISPTNGGPYEVNNGESMYTHEGEHEFVETIQIYEGSNSDLAIGLGVGFGSAFLLVFIWLIVSRERERRVEELLYSDRMSEKIPRRRLFKSRRRHYASYSNEARTLKASDDEISDEDQLLDEEEYYDEGEEAMHHHDSRHYFSAREERDRLFPKRFRRKRRVLDFQERVSPENSLELEEQYTPGTNERSSSIRRMIDHEEFSGDDYKDDNRNPKISPEKTDHQKNCSNKDDQKRKGRRR